MNVLKSTAHSKQPNVAVEIARLLLEGLLTLQSTDGERQTPKECKYGGQDEST